MSAVTSSTPIDALEGDLCPWRLVVRAMDRGSLSSSGETLNLGPGDYQTRAARKLKGVAVRIVGGRIRRAEIHWYEAHGLGRVRMKTKRFLD